MGPEKVRLIMKGVIYIIPDQIVIFNEIFGLLQKLSVLKENY
jgi:hypothetical protein